MIDFYLGFTPVAHLLSFIREEDRTKALACIQRFWDAQDALNYDEGIAALKELFACQSLPKKDDCHEGN